MDDVQIIGENVRIIQSKNICDNDLEGQVIDDTKNTIVISSNGPKRLLKGNITLKTDGRTIEGAKLKGRPHERFRK